MHDIIIYGAGGFGREVQVLLNQINNEKLRYNLIGFIDDNKSIWNTKINGIPVLGGLDYLMEFNQQVVVAVALIFDSRRQLIENLRKNTNLIFDNIIHPSLFWDVTNEIGIGNILCHGMNITCNIKIGDFNIFNGRVGVGHDVKIGNYNLFGPNSFIAGEVIIGDCNTFAMNSSIIQQKTVGNYNLINLNSVVIRNIKDNGTYFGVPALKQNF